MRRERHLSGSELEDLLLVLSRREDAVELPPAGEVERFLAGNATPEEAERVELALARSPSFRDELLILAATSRLRFAGEVGEPAVIPRRGERPRRAPRPRPEPVVVIPARRPRRGFWLGAGGIAVATVAVWAGVALFAQRPSLPLSDAAFDRVLVDEQFERDGTRSAGGGSEEPAIPGSAREAVLASFFAALEWTEGGWVAHEPAPWHASGPPYRFRVETEDGRSWEVKTALPEGARNPRVALLVLPERALSWVDTPPAGGRTRIALAGEQELFLAVAYDRDGHPAATPVLLHVMGH